ncbi:pitrilysin family protein [Methylomarinum sp. Ch1-1]|uniref:Pitrilysin family protein n=1 Tax=Methylomarinum roseum TaxID=3067653 RepID=A0AAU7NY14_9GAMM|nr:pitrilysin family protein [Methylomarinum sp. Ch1-1]MDP4522041.1 pitrilysin family protein [Methylomarinum sp. Ch1-1]
MRISWLTIVLMIFTQTAWSAATIEHWQSPQGSRVYYVQTEGLPMVDIRVTFDAGSARDGYQHGLAAITSAMLDAGAGEWDADQIAERFESVGAQFSTGVSRDMAWLSLRTLTEKPLFDQSIATLRAILADPNFDEADFQRKKTRTLAALKHREESPGALASIAFYQALYHDHPYAHPRAGVIETVAGFGVDDLRQFYRRYYVAANAMVVIVGDLSKKQAEQTAESLLAGLEVGERPQPIPEITMPDKGSTKHIEFPSTQTHVLSGLPGVRRQDEDYFPLYVGNHILGGSGLVSKLFEEVREKRGLAYSAYSYFSPMYRRGPFTMGLQTRNDQTGKAVRIMKKTLADFVANGPTEAELVAAKKNITGGFVLRFDTNRELAEYANMIGFYRLPLNYLEVFPQKVEAVTVEQIKDALQRRVKPELLQTVTVGGK